jgi:hypothetical protein
MSDWNPNDPALTAEKAPHETAGLLRWHRANVPPKEIMSMLRLRGTKLIASLERAHLQELEAERRGLEIHSAVMPEEEDE